MYAGGAGAILPNKVTSKHNFRYVPSMNGLDIVRKLKAQLVKNGYPDVDVKIIGDVPWALMNSDNEIGRAMQRTYEIMGIPHAPVRDDWGIGGGGAAAGGYWPAYMFGNGEVGEKISPGWPRARRQRVLRHRGCREGLRHGGRREGRGHHDVCLRRQDPGGREEEHELNF
jgi:hypothetical protein